MKQNNEMRKTLSYAAKLLASRIKKKNKLQRKYFTLLLGRQDGKLCFGTDVSDERDYRL